MKFKIKLKQDSKRKLPCLMAWNNGGVGPDEIRLVVLFTDEREGKPVIKNGVWLENSSTEDWVHYMGSNWIPCSISLTHKQ